MNDVLKKLEEMAVVPVVVIENAEDALPLAKALIKGGLACAEITFRTEAAKDAIHLISENYPEMIVGAGTVLTIGQAKTAMESGAKFIVSPGFNPKVASFCMENGMLMIPGCSNASDIEAALELGIKTVKFFPAEQAGGIAMIKALSAPYADVRFMPTGGINEKNIEKYLAEEVVLACGGSYMVKKDLIRKKEFDTIELLTRKAVETVQRIRGSEPQYRGNAMPHKEKDKVCGIDKVKNASGNKVVTFGELMLRLEPAGHYRFVQAESFGATFGGGEANVAVSLANFGYDVQFVTKLPEHEIGQSAVNSLRRFGVDTSEIIRGGDRMGIYYLEKGASQRPSKVIYDRKDSAIARAKAEEFDWERIFADATWFHFTGITPALGDETAKICLEACKAAKRLGLTISCDLNYRKKLWTKEKAGKIMAELCQYVDVCIANEEDASDVFGISAADTEVTSGHVSYEGYKEVARKLMERFHFRKVAVTLRTSISASDNKWAGMLYDGKEYYFSRTYDVHIVDRVGGGDSFGAGLIYSCMEGMAGQACIEFAVAASCLKHSVEGDYNMVTVDEVMALAGGNASGRVQR